MGRGNVYRETVAQMGKDGWLTLSWPKEFGGQARPPMDGLIFNDEASIANVPVPFLTINSVAPTIMAFGTDEQKKFFLPKIAAGDLHFSIGYSEPGAGTDLAALRTTAVRDGDDYVINGQKMWTSLIAYADYVWLAVRTNPEAKKHRGISMLIVPTTAEGFSWTPVHTMAGVDTSATYYQDVRVPATNLVGEENAGWKLVTNQLNHERVALVSAQPIFVALNGGSRMGAEHQGRARQPAHRSEWVQLNLARVHAKAEVLKLINWEASTEDAAPSPADASAAKVYGTELATEAYRLLMEVLGTAATVRTELPRRPAARPDRADAPVVPDPHLRRRHQRDSARHHRHGRARPAQSEPVRTFDMDFTTTEAAEDLGGLARTITDSVCTPERQRQLDGLDERFDSDLWAKLKDADILSTTAPESLGGGGFGVLEQVAVLVALGRQMAAVPYLESAVLGAGRWRSSVRRAAEGMGGAGGQRRQDRHGGARRRDGSGPGPGSGPTVTATGSPGRGRRWSTDRWPTRSWCRPKPIRAPRSSWSARTTPG